MVTCRPLCSLCTTSLCASKQRQGSQYTSVSVHTQAKTMHLGDGMSRFPGPLPYEKSRGLKPCWMVPSPRKCDSETILVVIGATGAAHMRTQVVPMCFWHAQMF